jgi:hypothetical protein
MKATMKEWKAGALHSGSKTGPRVQSRAQAIAIGLSEQRAAKKQGHGKASTAGTKHATPTKHMKAATQRTAGDLIRHAMGG